MRTEVDPTSASGALPPRRQPLPLQRQALSCELARVSSRSFEDPWTASEFAVELARPHARLALEREASGALVAYALGWRVVDEIQVLQVAVAPHTRGVGLGRRLLEDWFRALRREGVVRASLDVRETNAAARALYRGLGLEEEGRRRGYYRDGEDAILVAGAL